MNATIIGGLILVGLLGLSRYQVMSLKKDMAEMRTQHAEAGKKASEEYRVKEQALVTFSTRTANELHEARTQLSAAVLAADQRLRDRARVWAPTPAASASAAACRDLDAPAVAILPGSTRGDLVELARKAEDVRLNLLACQKDLVETRRVCGGN